MNIAVDITPIGKKTLSQHKFRGVGKYIEGLVKSLKKYDKQNKYIFYKKGDELPNNVDVLHIPYFEPFFISLPLVKRFKTVVTIHDLIPIIFKEHFPAGLRGNLRWQIQKFLATKVDFTITDSENSKKDIERIMGIGQNKIEAIYLAAGQEFRVIEDTKKLYGIKKKYNLPQKFVLYVGDATWNKNLNFLIDAVEKLNYPLVLVGKALGESGFDKNNLWNKELVVAREKISKSKSICALGFVPNEDLVGIYNLATLFAMPSIYEGFGLPALEAMSCGCPVVSSKTGSLKEVVDDAGLLIDPNNMQELVDGIKKVYSNENLREELKKKGKKRARSFSWEKTAIQTVKVYEKITESF